ncbi:MAG TPA: SpoIIE family protein phosphatase [Mycobacteriales bacterium]|nr:SpoIIE family protein phosphatase [Mycobacteriales bacterium]
MTGGGGVDAGPVAQHRLEHLVRSSPAVVYCLEPAPPYRLTFVSGNVARLLGCSAAQLLADPAPLGGRLHPEDVERFTAALADLPVTGQAVTEHRLRAPDGGWSWVRDEQVLARDDAGRPVEIVGWLLDVTGRRRTEERAERLQQLTEQLAAALSPEQVAGSALLPALSVLGARGLALLLREPGADPAMLTVVGAAGYPAEIVQHWRRLPLDDVTPGGVAVLTGAPVYLGSWEEAHARFPAMFQAPGSSRQRAWAALPLRSGGQVIGALAIGFSTARGIAPDERGFLETVATQCALAVERSRLYGTAATERERLTAAGERLGRLQQVTAGLAEALTVEQVAAVMVRGGLSVAGCRSAWIGVLNDPGTELVALAASFPVEPDGPAARIPLDAASPRAEVTRTGQPVWLPSTADALAQYPGLKAIGIADGALGVVPLVSHGRPIGAMMLSFAVEGAFDAHERALIITLAEQCAQALERARLHERAHDVALALQQSMLPTALPEVPGLELTARYHPAIESLEVGGDWYDVVALPGGRVGLTVGDVVGRGLGAATTMGQLRSALAALALSEESPARTLDGLERFARQVEGARLATVAYGVLDPVGGSFRYACAGHPPPLVIDPDGTATYLEDGRSPLLCALPPGATGPRGEATVLLEPGARLLMYSDGLVERRREQLDVGLARLAEQSVAVGDGPGWSDELVRRMLLGAGDDDVALLGVTYAPVLRIRRAARPELLSGMRRELRAWLTAVGVEGETVSDVLLACGEAVANAVEHGFHDGSGAAGELVLELRLGAGRELTIRVTDTGNWRQVPAPGDRGRGLPLMKAVMDEVEVESGKGGTVVSMRRRSA